MEIFETNLAGTDGLIDGVVSTTMHPDSDRQHYTFSSIDGSLEIEIVKDNGHWKRVSSTEPYLTGWINELGDQIDQRNSPAF